MQNTTGLKTVSELLNECKNLTKDTPKEDKQQKAHQRRIEKPKGEPATAERHGNSPRLAGERLTLHGKGNLRGKHTKR